MKNTKNLIKTLVLQEIKMFFEKRGSEFKFHVFKSLPSGKEKDAYAKEHLQFLGKGIGRSTYAWKAGKVLKIAFKHTEGHTYSADQNRQEVEALTNADYAEILPKLIDYDREDFTWILVEAVKTLDKNASLSSQLKLTKDFIFMSMFEGNLYKFSEYPLIEVLEKTISQYHKNGHGTGKESVAGFSNLEMQLLEKIYEFVPKGFLDVSRVDHWGMTMDGRLVIVDTGLVNI